jgi:hypothetical protein
MILGDNMINEALITEGEPPVAIRIPLDEVSFSTRSMGSGCKNDDGEEDSLVSDMSEDDESQQRKIVDSVPRSIFSTYYEANPTAAARKRSANPPTKRIQRLAPQHSDPDPFEFFGIKRPERHGREDENDSSSSMNTYERVLQQHESSNNPLESRPFWMSFFGGNGHASEPHLTARNLHQRNAYSDSVLIRKPKTSCLRRGRFSTLQDANEATDHCSPKAISFQSSIEVRVYERPVEQFASKGWSDFFG